MEKQRVYEFAREHDKSSKEIINLAQEVGIDYSSHMVSMTPEEMKKIEAALSGQKTPDNTKSSQENKQGQAKEEKKSSNKPAENKQGQKASGQAQGQNKEKQGQGLSSGGQKQAAKSKQASNNQNRNNNRKNKRNNRRHLGTHGGVAGSRNKKQQAQNHPTPRKERELPETLEYTEGMNIAELAKKLHRDPAEMVKKLFMLGVMANQNQALDDDTIEILITDYGVEPIKKVEVDLTDFETFMEADHDEEDLVKRPPVVTIMGHVDHGKTTLLDTLRQSSVTEGEAGGITQHIGAYQVEQNDELITFLDTPGHAAFTTMRARGADVTDIAIIVVAADDGVMPQTVEAINHAKAAEVPIIVAVNKIDKPTANPDRVKQELMEYELIPEDWGGDTIFVEISALHGQNIDELLEMVLLVAEVEELQANPDGRPLGSVIEARLDKAKGAVTTILVQDGTLKVQDPIVVGNTYGRIRTMVDDQGQEITEAGPSTPVEITGLNTTPEAGDQFVVFEDEKTARSVGEERAERALIQDRRSSNPVSLDNLFESLQEGELKSVNVIIKADVRGSVEALTSSLEKIDVEGAKVNIVHTGVGAINESDVTLATASGALILGFNVRPVPQAKDLAEREQVEIRTYNVIYNLIDDVENAMKGMLDPEFEEQVIGHLSVRETYKVSKVGTIAGCYVNSGKITRQSQVRLIRNGVVIYDGELASLRRFEDDVREVANGYECGLMIKDYNDIKVDDEIEAYEMVEVRPN